MGEQQMSSMQLERLKNMAEIRIQLAKVKEAADEFYGSFSEPKISTPRKRRRDSSDSEADWRRAALALPSRRSCRLKNVTPQYTELPDDVDARAERTHRKHARLSFSGHGYSGHAHKTQAKFTLELDWDRLLRGDNGKEVLCLEEDGDAANDLMMERELKRALELPYKPYLQVQDVTAEMLRNVCHESHGKLYDRALGTSCHQCRQKTLDTKSVCRYPFCSGVRGMFCGFCLQRHYGEAVEHVLLQEDWACPSCRGLCNCSICRNKAGLPALGQVSLPEQYRSVHHMLLQEEARVSNVDNFVRFYNPSAAACAMLNIFPGKSASGKASGKTSGKAPAPGKDKDEGRGWRQHYLAYLRGVTEDGQAEGADVKVDPPICGVDVAVVLEYAAVQAEIREFGFASCRDKLWQSAGQPAGERHDADTASEADTEPAGERHNTDTGHQLTTDPQTSSGVECSDAETSDEESDIVGFESSVGLDVDSEDGDFYGFDSEEEKEKENFGQELGDVSKSPEVQA